jgi:hypothetical protein
MILNKAELKNALLKGSGFEGGKKRINKYFLEDHTNKEYADFLKREYGTGGSSLLLKTHKFSFMDYNEKGMKFTVRNNDEYQYSLLTWTDVATRIKKLVDSKEYINKNRVDVYPIPLKCPYCKSKVVFASNSSIYGKEFGNGMVYRCTDRFCNSYVGVHTGTKIPLGRIANKELRQLKSKAHFMFDKYWESKKYYRDTCYKQLAFKLDIKVSECHFGWFDKDMLLKSINILKDGLFD